VERVVAHVLQFRRIWRDTWAMYGASEAPRIPAKLKEKRAARVTHRLSERVSEKHRAEGARRSGPINAQTQRPSVATAPPRSPGNEKSAP